MSGRCYRPRPDNGSGDSPRPPFLTEFVNHIRELFFAHVVYHLIGGGLAARVHAHVERRLRLKTESPAGIFKLERTHAQVGQNSIGRTLRPALAQFGKARLQQRYLWPFFFLARRRLQSLPRPFQCARVFIEANQMTRWAEATCDCVAVAAQTQRGVDISPAALDPEKIDRFL